MARFRVTASNTDSGIIKYISWTDPITTGSGQTFGRMERTKVVVQDALKDNLMGYPITQASEV